MRDASVLGPTAGQRREGVDDQVSRVCPLLVQRATPARAGTTPESSSRCSAARTTTAPAGRTKACQVPQETGSEYPRVGGKAVPRFSISMP
jgi:hypothetical protein